MSRHRVVASGALAGVLVLALLAGCGKRGPLYLPGDKDKADEPVPQQETPEQSQPPDTSGP